MSTTPPHVIRFGVFEADVRSGELRKSGWRVPVQEQPFKILTLLLRRPGEVVTREEIRQELWPADTFVDFERSLNAGVKRLRDALNDSAEAPRFIETVPRHGYRFVAPIHVAGAAPVHEVSHHPPQPRRRGLRVAASAAGVATLAGTLWLAAPRQIGEDALVAQLEIRVPDGAYFPAQAPRAAVSPDGRMIAFLAGSRLAGEHELWLRRLDALEPEPVPGTKRAFYPTWSPRGDGIVFPAIGQVRRFDLATRAVVALADGLDGGPASWSVNDDILFTAPHGGLSLVPARGGPAVRVTTPDPNRGELSHYFPHFLPDGRSFLYYVNGSSDAVTGVYLGHLNHKGATRILEGTSHAEFVSPGYLVYARGLGVFAQPFDLRRGALAGEPVQIAEGVSHGAKGTAGFSVSASGVLAFSPRPRLPLRQLVWFDRAGRRLSTLGNPATIDEFALSPDEQWIAAQRTDAPRAPSDSLAPDIWIMDAERGTARQVTVNPANDVGPVWAPDSRRFVYARHRGIQEPADIHLRSRDDETDEPLLAAAVSEHPYDWSSDGRFMLYTQPDAGRNADLWVLSLDAPRRARPWRATDANEWQARFSPDGKWVAYTSNESGQAEVYVRPLQGNGPPWQVSRGGAVPRWSRAGDELFYVSPERELMRAAVQSTTPFQTATPLPLFQLHRVVADVFTQTRYAVSVDGRFLILETMTEPGEVPIFVRLNWQSALPKQAAARGASLMQ